MMIRIFPVHVIITAAGSSTRLGTGTKKEYISVQDKDNNTVLSLSCIGFLNTFLDSRVSPFFKLASFVVTCPKNKIPDGKKALFANKNVENLFEQLGIEPVFVEGGETRQLSVLKALEACKTSCSGNVFPSENSSSDEKAFSDSSLVLIHDGARPWVDFQTIYNVLCVTREKGACVPYIPVTDTIALQKDGTIDSYINRSLACSLQTPQGFLFEKLFEAHKKSLEENRTDCTDDTTVWKAYCGKVFTCEGSPKNTKITFASDLEKLKTE